MNDLSCCLINHSVFSNPNVVKKKLSGYFHCMFAIFKKKCTGQLGDSFYLRQKLWSLYKPTFYSLEASQWAQHILTGRWLLKSINIRRWESMKSSSEAAYHFTFSPQISRLKIPWVLWGPMCRLLPVYLQTMILPLTKSTRKTAEVAVAANVLTSNPMLILIHSWHLEWSPHAFHRFHILLRVSACIYMRNFKTFALQHLNSPFQLMSLPVVSVVNAMLSQVSLTPYRMRERVSLYE